jgi:UPF0755 protein
VIEGLTIGQTLDSIARQTDIPFADLSRPLLDGTIVSTLMPDEPQSLQDWEGLLFPDTYEFDLDASAEEILGRMASTMDERVGSVDWTYLDALGYTPYEGIVIASLVEKEALFDDDRPVIASVIFNRLGIEMALQLDVTVIYALGGLPDGGLTLEDLEVDSPYNTYLVTGLPPTPISTVRIASLRAAATPDETPYFYFLADEDGRAHFAETFEEFLELQEEYLSP